MKQQIIITMTDEKIEVDYNPSFPNINDHKSLPVARVKLLDLCSRVARRAVHEFNFER